jgi:2-polyprenyl-3-methyl-5-hydroxy-6-metoxy-1,4-benzoquinol methylase
VRERYDPDYFQIKHANWVNNPDTSLHDDIGRIIASRFGKNAAVIDIGCGKGDFLKHLVGCGFTNLAGLDIIDQDQGAFRYFKTPVEAFDSSETFDAIVSLANVEHIDDVRHYMKRLAKLLAPGGLLVVYTVDNGSLLYRASKALFSMGITFAARRLYDPHHVNHFSVRSLAILAASQGLKVERLTRRNMPMSAVTLAKTPLTPAVYGTIRVIDLVSAALGKQMLQLALFSRDSSEDD